MDNDTREYIESQLGILRAELYEVKSDINYIIQERICRSEYDIQSLREKFTTDTFRTVIDLFRKYEAERELTGMTDEEFEAELYTILFG